MSEVTNVKVVRFEDGRKEGYGETLYAHDWGQKIRFEGIELPENYEVHFSDLPDGIGTPRLGNADGVDVPRAYLMHPGMLYLWIFLHFGDGDGTTVYRAVVEVAQKADGSVTPSEEEKDIIQQAVEALNGANEVVERAEEVSDHMDRMLAAAEAMPQATYLECSLLGHYGAVYEIRPEGSPIPASTDCLGLIMNKPEGYDPRDNDLLFIKMTKDLAIPERREAVVDIQIVFDMSWTDYSGERPIVYTGYESYEILNIGHEYPAGLVAFEKNRIYTFRHRLVPTGGGNNKSAYEIINYAPGMKEAVTEMQTLVANTRTEMNNLVQNTAVRHDISQGLSVTQKATARANIGAAMLENGKVPESQLPSYVDDVLEYASLSAFPATGEAGKIYVALDTNLTYRWSGSTYIEISKSLALGEVAGTAFPGERGKAVENALAEVNKNVYATVTDVQTAPGGFVINCETDEEYVLRAGDILYIKYTDNVQTVNASNQYAIRLSDQNGSVYFTAVIGNIGATEYPAGITVFENGHTYAYYYNGTNLQVVGLDAANLGDTVGTAFPGERGKAVEEDAEEALARAKITYGQCTEIVTNPNRTPRPEGSLIQRQIKVDVPEGYEPRDGDYLTVTFQADEVSSPPQAYRIHYNYKGADIALDGAVKGLGDVDRFADGETVFEAGSSYLFRYDGVNGWWWIVGYRYGVSLGETALTAFPGDRGKTVENEIDSLKDGVISATSHQPKVGQNGNWFIWDHVNEQYVDSGWASSGSAQDAKNAALKAEGYAVGKQDGVDVTPDSPYYENNAKYWAQLTADAETAATQAIQAKGEEVLESIPADYTALSRDVENVKSALTNERKLGNRTSGIYTDHIIISEGYWKGKKAVINGDSIAAGNLGYEQEQLIKVDTPFGEYAFEKLGVTVIENYAIGGATLSSGSVSVQNTLRTMDRTADVVLISAGANDWTHHVTLGTPSDKTTATFYGALYVTLDYLTDIYVNKHVLFCTPVRQRSSGAVNNNGNTLDEFRAAIIEMCGRFNVSVVDLTKESRVDPNIWPTAFYDGVHPLQIGHDMLGEYLSGVLIKRAAYTMKTTSDYTVKGSFANLIYETLGLYVDENGDINQREVE